MVVIGGITRLTLSGLSITEWKPVVGILPPLSPADWAAEFAKYKEIPQYQLVQNTMTRPTGIELPPSEPLLHFAARQDVLVWPPRPV